jgi:hypothetical protein
VILANLGLYPFEAIETPQHGDEIILLCGIIHGSDILRYGSFGVRMCNAARCAADFSNPLGLDPFKSARCYAHNLMSDDAMPARSA